MICNISVALVWYIVSKWIINNLLEPWKNQKKNHSRHTPFRMCVVALFFVLAWWRVFMTNSLPAKIARKLQANRNFWKAAAILKPVGGNWGDFNLVSRFRGVVDFDRGTRPVEKQKQSKKDPHRCESNDLRKWKTRRLKQPLTFCWWKCLHIEEGTRQKTREDIPSWDGTGRRWGVSRPEDCWYFIHWCHNKIFQDIPYGQRT